MPATPLSIAQIVRALRRLETGWNHSLILFGGPHTLTLLRAGFSEPIRQSDIVAEFTIPADGGDPGWEPGHEETE